MLYYTRESQEVLDSLGANHNGLSEAEAQARLVRNGKNKLIEGKKISLFRRFLSQLADPMIIVLLVAAGFVIVNFIVDLLYAVLDPRIRHGHA